MSNAVKSLSAQLAQCVKHQSANQTLTGSNLAEHPLYFFYHNKYLFFLQCTSFRSVVFQLNMVGIRVHVFFFCISKNEATAAFQNIVLCVLYYSAERLLNCD